MLKSDSKQIGEHAVTASAWPFLSMMKRKRRIIQGLTASGGSLISYFTNDEDGAEDEEDFDSLIKGIQTFIGAMSEKDMVEFIGWIFETVHVNGADMSNSEDREVILAGESALFYQIALFVLEVTYGDFFEMGKTLIAKFQNGEIKLPTQTNNA